MEVAFLGIPLPRRTNDIRDQAFGVVSLEGNKLIGWLPCLNDESSVAERQHITTVQRQQLIVVTLHREIRRKCPGCGMSIPDQRADIRKVYNTMPLLGTIDHQPCCFDLLAALFERNMAEWNLEPKH